MLAFGATVPGAHLRASALPTGQPVPAGQAAHPAAEVRPWLALYVPAGQGSLWALVDPLSQKWPGAHGPEQSELLSPSTAP